MTENQVEIPLVRKFAIFRTVPGGSIMDREYWNVGEQKWGNVNVMIDDPRSGATLFDTYGEAKFLADRLQADVTPVWSDR